MGKTSIEWTRGDDGTAGSTWNPVRGCSRVSPGCGGPNHQGGCYAEKIAARFSGPGQPFEGFAERTKHGGAWTGKLALVDDMLTLPLRWRKSRRIFVNSMSDLFHEALPDEAIVKVFAVMALCPQHTFQVLTKRAERMRKFVTWLGTKKGFAALEKACREFGYTLTFEGVGLRPFPLPNVWLGVSVEDQERADERIPDLLATPAAKRFLSCEPLLGPVDLREIGDDGWNFPLNCLTGKADTPKFLAGKLDAPSTIGWVISGGESGPGARPMHPDWARSLRDQCQTAGVRFFFKQWGEWLPGENDMIDRPCKPAQWQDGETGQHSTCKDRPESRTPDWRHFTEPGKPGAFALRVGKKRAGALLDGREWREFPT